MKWARYIWNCGGFILHNYNKYIKKYAKHKEKYSQEVRYAFMHDFLVKLTKKLGVVSYVNGQENINENDVSFYAPNHQSAYDPLLITSFINKPTSFVSKIELEKKPFIGNAIKSLDGLFMKRDDLRQSLKVMKQVSESLSNGVCNWMVYPEGTRTRDPEHKLGEFKHGTFKIAVNSKKDIVPVAIWGMWRLFSNAKEDQLKVIPVQVTFLKPLKYEEYKDMNTAEIAQTVQGRIEAEIEELKKNDLKILMENNPKKFKHNKKLA